MAWLEHSNTGNRVSGFSLFVGTTVWYSQGKLLQSVQYLEHGSNTEHLTTGVVLAYWLYVVFGMGLYLYGLRYLRGPQIVLERQLVPIYLVSNACFPVSIKINRPKLWFLPWFKVHCLLLEHAFNI